MRYLFFSYLSWYAGSERMLPIIMNNLSRDKDNRVVFICNSHTDYLNQISEFLDDKIEIIPLELYHENFTKKRAKCTLIFLLGNIMNYVCYISRKLYFVFKNLQILSRSVTETEFDVVHVNNGGYPGSLAAIGFVLFSYRLKFKKLYFIVNNLAVSRKHPLRIFDWPLDFLVTRRVTSFVTASNFAGGRLRSVLKTSKVCTIPNAVSIDSKHQNHKRLYDHFVVGMIGILERRKGHEIAIKAFQSVIKEIPNAVLYIEGEGELRDKLNHLIQDLGLTGQVKLVGRAYNIWEFYSGLDVLLFTSVNNEDMPNVISEAQGLGVPVVSHKIAGTVEQIIHDKTGYLIDIGNEEMLINSLKKLVDEETRRKFSENAKIHYLKNFSPEISIKRYLNLYNN